MAWSKTFKLDGSDDKEIEKFVADVQAHGIGTAIINGSDGDLEYVPHDKVFIHPSDTVTLPKATVDALREALKPFANAVDDFKDEPYNLEIELVGDDTKINPCIMVDNLRKAAAALALLDGKVLEKDNG